MFIPEGFLFSAISCGIKEKNRLDVGLIYSPYVLTSWGVFTTNTIKAAPVIIGKKYIKNKKIFGIIANSGIANACTGEEGIKKVEILIKELTKKLKLPPESILPASTGIIGKQLPLEKILSKFDFLVASLSPSNYVQFAKAIMTTDTFPKVVSEKTKDDVIIMGIAKGAGMIAPNMATMLAFILTDAKLSKEYLKKELPKMVEKSFNCINVDGDMSTNDTVYMLSSNLKEIKDWEEFQEVWLKIMKTLSYLIIKDGEGTSKVIKIIIKGAKTKKEAKILGNAVANSPLVKTAFYGEDPNWGRIFSALGKTQIKFDPEKIKIYVNRIPWIINLKVIEDESKIRLELKKDYIELLINLNQGRQGCEILTTDLTEEYIKINAHYRT